MTSVYEEATQAAKAQAEREAIRKRAMPGYKPGLLTLDRVTRDLTNRQVVVRLGAR